MNFCYSDCLKNWMLSSVINNGDFDKFLADNYTDRDGFISFTPNNWDDWFEGYMDNEWKCVSALLRFFVEYELTYNDVESYTYDFDEQARTIIMENYTPYEYAVKYDDGCIAIITLEYNKEDGVEEYLARLFDTDGKFSWAMKCGSSMVACMPPGNTLILKGNLPMTKDLESRLKFLEISFSLTAVVL